jgi:hypothetical protein
MKGFIMNRKQMKKDLIERELLWLIDNPGVDNVMSVADWLMSWDKLYDTDGALLKQYEMAFNDD